jgi:hypothetical protein
MIQNQLGIVTFNSNTSVQEYPATARRKKKRKTNLQTRSRSAEKESNHSVKKMEQSDQKSRKEMTYYFKDLNITNLFYNAWAKRSHRQVKPLCLDLAYMAVKDARGCASKVVLRCDSIKVLRQKLHIM